MGDHFVLFMDQLLTESTLEAAIERLNNSQQAMASANKHDRIDDYVVASTPSKSVQCRICHDDDEDSNMEIPCSCRGSLKYVHRKCVQRWCNEKGNITCEICHQEFKPGYTAPAPPLLHYGGVPMNLRDLPSPHFITYDRDFMESGIDDDSTTSSRSLICCRVVAIIFTVLLVLRHTLPIIIIGTNGDYSMTLFTLVMLRAIGIMLPVCIMVKAFTAIQRRRRRRRHQDPRFSLYASDEESDLPQLQQQPQQSRLIRVH